MKVYKIYDILPSSTLERSDDKFLGKQKCFIMYQFSAGTSLPLQASIHYIISLLTIALLVPVLDFQNFFQIYYVSNPFFYSFSPEFQKGRERSRPPPINIGNDEMNQSLSPTFFLSQITKYSGLCSEVKLFPFLFQLVQCYDWWMVSPLPGDVLKGSFSKIREIQSP